MVSPSETCTAHHTVVRSIYVEGGDFKGADKAEKWSARNNK